MELNDLQNTWQKMDSQANEKISKLNTNVNQFKISKYNSKWQKIRLFEYMGIGVCLLGAFYIAMNFNNLETLFIKIAGTISILVLVLISIFSYISLKSFHLKNDITITHKSALLLFAKNKIKFLKIQKINLLLSHLLLLTFIVVLPKIVSNITIFEIGTIYSWFYPFVLGYIFLLVYSTWVNKYYSKLLLENEFLLKEITE